MREGRIFEMPEMPKRCARCGTPYGLSRQPFRFGTRTVDLFACPPCWKRYEKSRIVVRTASTVGAVAAAGGTALSVASLGVAPAVVGCGLAAALAGVAFAYRRANAPRRVKGDGVVVDVPGTGPVRVA
jgi:hypothetical protein